MVFFLVTASLAASAVPVLCGAPQQWQSIGPPGGDVADLVYAPGNPARVYAVVKTESGQVYVSSDSGLNWSRLAAFGEPVYSMAIDPSNTQVMYVLGKEAVMKTTDGGATWTRSAFGSYWYGEGGEIAVHPLDPQLVLATGYNCYLAPASWESGVAFFKSVDGGESWSSACLDATWLRGQGLAIAVNPLDTGEFFIAGYESDRNTGFGRIYRTVDGGLTWTNTAGAWTYSVQDILVDPAHPATVLAATTWFVQRSLDGGLTWTLCPGGYEAHTLAVDIFDSSNIYAGGTSAVYRTTDGGAHWTGFGVGGGGVCQAFLAQGSELFYGSASGIRRSGNAGTSWQVSQNGLLACDARSLVVAPSSPRTIYVVSGDSIARSNDGGNTWEFTAAALCSGWQGNVGVDPLNANIVFALDAGG